MSAETSAFRFTLFCVNLAAFFNDGNCRGAHARKRALPHDGRALGATRQSGRFESRVNRVTRPRLFLNSQPLDPHPIWNPERNSLAEKTNKTYHAMRCNERRHHLTIAIAAPRGRRRWV